MKEEVLLSIAFFSILYLLQVFYVRQFNTNLLIFLRNKNFDNKYCTIHGTIISIYSFLELNKIVGVIKEKIIWRDGNILHTLITVSPISNIKTIEKMGRYCVIKSIICDCKIFYIYITNILLIDTLIIGLCHSK